MLCLQNLKLETTQNIDSMQSSRSLNHRQHLPVTCYQLHIPTSKKSSLASVCRLFFSKAITRDKKQPVWDNFLFLASFGSVLFSPFMMSVETAEPGSITHLFSSSSASLFGPGPEYFLLPVVQSCCDVSANTIKANLPLQYKAVKGCFHDALLITES